MFTPRWILHPDRLYIENQLNNKKSVEIILIIILIIIIKKKTDRLIKNRLNFKNIKKIVLYFQKADPRAIYYKYYEIRHEKPKIYEDKPSIYEIYGKNHYTNNHTYNMIIYKSKKKRRCLYDLIKYENYISIN